MFMQKVLARAVAAIKRGMCPPAASRPRRIFNGAARAYWPVLLGGSVAIVLVGAGLTVAVQSVRRPSPQWSKTPSKAIPRLIIEERIVRGVARPEAPPFAFAAKAALPGTIPAPKFQELAMILQPPAPEIEVDSNPQDATYDTYGTSVNFMRSPTAAVRKARKEDKLLFTLHVSGNFEDPQFT
jgi:hypothetical protein